MAMISWGGVIHCALETQNVMENVEVITDVKVVVIVCVS